MKQLLLMLMASGSAVSALAQKPASHNHADSLIPRWAIDVNLMGGMGVQDFTTANSIQNYPNALNANTGNLTYKKGSAYGADLQLGYFFGKKRHFGIGTGFMYMMQKGDAVLDNFNLEYQATDGSGNIYRQVLTGHDIRETVTSTNINIPLVLKYKKRFSKHWGFAADAGAVFNLEMKNAYESHATFDYAAIYKLVKGTDGKTVSVYDNNPTASPNDWFITRAEFLKNNPNGILNAYFNDKKALGFVLGDGLTTGTRKGNVSYAQGSVGLIVRPTISYYLCNSTAIDLGVFYMWQPFKSNAQSGYKLTDGTGAYSSVLNNVTASNNQVYGVNLGVKFFMGRKDRDHDGIVDRKDKCPDVWGLAKFNGCPDTDGDGIQDSEDSCVLVAGLAKFHGCPDSDGDGIPDKVDSCPFQAGKAALYGCPDRDGDGIADRYDACPDVVGLAQFNGCPDTDGDGIPDKDDKCPTEFGPASNDGCPVKEKIEVVKHTTERLDISTPILFDLNKSSVHVSSFPVIEEAVTEMKEDKHMRLIVDGNADTTGIESHNRVLSLQRANSVKKELVKRGVSPSRVKTVGHGSRVPVDTNETPEGRQRNRRGVMHSEAGH